MQMAERDNGNILIWPTYNGSMQRTRFTVTFLPVCGQWQQQRQCDAEQPKQTKTIFNYNIMVKHAQRLYGQRLISWCLMNVSFFCAQFVPLSLCFCRPQHAVCLSAPLPPRGRTCTLSMISYIKNAVEWRTKWFYLQIDGWNRWMPPKRTQNNTKLLCAGTFRSYAKRSIYINGHIHMIWKIRVKWSTLGKKDLLTSIALNWVFALNCPHERVCELSHEHDYATKHQQSKHSMEYTKCI